MASVLCESMSEVLLATENFEGVKLHAIDINKFNFMFISEKYSNRLVCNELHVLEMNSLRL